MGFNVAEDVEPLEYNFGAYGDGETHRIKEPSDKQVRRFWRDIAKEERVATAELQATIARRYGETDDVYAARLTADAEALEDEQVAISEASRHRVLGIISAVCSGDPSVELLEKLDERPFVKFFAYLRAELVPKG